MPLPEGFSGDCVMRCWLPVGYLRRQRRKRRTAPGCAAVFVRILVCLKTLVFTLQLCGCKPLCARFGHARRSAL